MKQVLITIENKHHLETELINADGHTFTYNPSGKNEGLEDFFISAPEEKIQLLMDGMEISNKLIKEILTEKTKSELGEFIYTNLTNAYWRNEGAINKYLNQDAELTDFCDGKQKCEHENEIMKQGDGTVYGYCGDCGKELY